MMKALLILLLCSTSTLFADPTITAAAPNPPRLFLHLFKPTYWDASGKSTPPERIISVEVQPGQNIDVAIGAYSEGLQGRIEPREKGFHATLTGSYGTSTESFTGEIELEKPFEPTGGIFSGGICRVFFVLSVNRDCEPFLKQQAAQDAGQAQAAVTK